MAILHHLAGAGGTLITRCLACMDGVAMLSEISPAGVSNFCPLKQAQQWHGWLSTDEVRELPQGDSVAFFQAIELLLARSQQQDAHFVVRDWSHCDWIGFPFAKATMRSSWELPAEQSWTPKLEAWLTVRCATVRHPLDQYLGSKALNSLSAAWEDDTYWRGVRAFAESIQCIPWWRYEDFLHSPETILRGICESLQMPFDANWQHRWSTYRKITGEQRHSSRTTIGPTARDKVSDDVWNSLRRNEDFFATLDLLQYPTPEPLQRRWYGGSDVGRNDSEQVRLHRPLLTTANWDAEVKSWRDKIQTDARDTECHLKLAEALGWIGCWDDAASELLSLFDGCEDWPIETQSAYYAQACTALEKAERKFDSIPLRRRWAQIAPQNKGNLFQLSLLLANVGEVDEALSYCRRLLNLDIGHLGAAANYLLYMNYSDRYDAAEISNEHFRIGMRFAQPAATVSPRPRMAQERLRLGYLGSDFYTHPVGKIMLPILQSHDRDRFEISVYHDGTKSDAITHEMRSAVDCFTQTNEWNDDRLTDAIRRDELDVLIDLGGYTGGGNRLGALARRLAPVQASFLGYPHTSAIPAMDYRLTDRYADPPGLTDHLYGEQLVWLNHAHLAWKPYPIATSIVAVPSEYPTVGIFNNVAKLSPMALSAYASILRRVPDARVVLKYGDRYGVAAVRNRYRQRFAELGVLPHRVMFRKNAETLEQHLKTMANVDLALDAFPYQGTMTSLECLSVGTPIVSCCGDYYAHRATSAMMMRMGLQELIAHDAEEYVEIAVELLQERDSLAAMRALIRDRFYGGALTDPVGLVRELEQKLLSFSR